MDILNDEEKQINKKINVWWGLGNDNMHKWINQYSLT